MAHRRPPPVPRIFVGWVGRRFILLDTFEATLPSSTPAHSPIVACTSRWLSTTMVGFTSAAKAPAPQAVTPCLYDLRAFTVVGKNNANTNPTGFQMFLDYIKVSVNSNGVCQ